MMSFTQYLVVSNIALVLFYGAYQLFRKNETQFSFLRFTLLGGILLALILPLLNISEWFFWIEPDPSTNQNFLSDWVPEIVITPQDIPTIVVTPQKGITLWQWAQWIYMGVAALLFIQLAVKIFLILRLKFKSMSYRWQGLTVCEVDNESVAFTFFKTIFLGKSANLSASEKEQVLKHESVHAKNLHSLDIIFIRLVQVFFWFNPALVLIRKSLNQLHEFEADHKSIEGEKSDRYVNLLVRYVLMGSGMSVTNHFSKSEVLKRIAMINASKSKISNLKKVGFVSVVLLILATVACEQKLVADSQKETRDPALFPGAPKYTFSLQDLEDLARKISLDYLLDAMDVHTHDTLRIVHQAKSYRKIYPHAKPKLYGFVRTDDISIKKNKLKEVSAIIIYADTDPGEGFHAMLPTKKLDYDSLRFYEDVKGERVYSIVQEPASPVGGLSELYKFIAENMRYPTLARWMGVEGRVFLKLIVDENGKLSNIQVTRGIGAGCDSEALRVMKLSPVWNPGKENGVAVKSIYNLVIIFKLDEKSDGDNSTIANSVQ